jgi:hypothetical protein
MTALTRDWSSGHSPADAIHDAAATLPAVAAQSTRRAPRGSATGVSARF